MEGFCTRVESSNAMQKLIVEIGRLSNRVDLCVIVVGLGTTDMYESGCLDSGARYRWHIVAMW